MCIECEIENRSRRAFLANAATAIAGVALGAKAIAQENSKQEISKNRADSKITSEAIKFPNGKDLIDGYLARPNKEGKFRAVLILHGNAGLPEDVNDTAEKMAELGFVGLAVSSTSREPDISRITQEFLMSDSYIKRYISDAQAGIEYLKKQNFFNSDKYGVLGYCGGGYTAARMALIDPKVAAVVALYAAPAFYAPRVSKTDPRPNLVDFVERIKIPIQFHYGTKDHLIPFEDVEKLRQTIKSKSLNAEVFAYEEADHGFANYVNPNYKKDAAEAAERRCRKFLLGSLK